MIEVLLTTLETEMSTTAVDQDQVLAEQTVDQDLAEQTVDQDLAEQIAQIVSKEHETVRAPKTTDGISSEVAYRYIQYLEDKDMFREELMACERCKWADFLVMLPYSKRSPEFFEKTLDNLNAFLTKSLLEILEIGAT